MFNIGFSEMLVIAVLALILIGPKQLPEVARTIGRFINELKRGSDAFSSDLKNAADKFLETDRHNEIPRLTKKLENEKSQDG